MKAILINSKTQTIQEYENTGLESLQAAVNGLIETGTVLETGDCVFVDEEGLLKENDMFFAFIDGSAQHPFPGNGVVVGPADNNGDDKDCLLSVEDIEKRVMFLTRAQVIQWINENSQHERTMGFRRYN